MILKGISVRTVFYIGLVLHLTEACSKLELVQVVFRHGDRTPDENEVYPKAPYNPAYKILGFGQLTDKGKIREYHLGNLLQKRYNSLLGDVNRHGDIYAVSTDYERTKMSLQLVLNGLYPPAKNTTNQIAWYPVPTSYSPLIVDMIMMPVRCPKYLGKVKEAMNSSAIRKIVARHSDFFDYIAENTGWDMSTQPIGLTALLYQYFIAQESMGVPLPSWVTPRVQKNINEIATLSYEILSYTPELRRLNGGPLIKEFIRNMNYKGTNYTPKFYLYSCHELNIAAFAKAHYLSVPRIPEYGSAIIVETWRGISGQRFIKMFLWTGVTKQLYAYKLPKCGKICPYDRYVQLVKDVIPSDEESNCLWNNVTVDKLHQYYDQSRIELHGSDMDYNYRFP